MIDAPLDRRPPWTPREEPPVVDTDTPDPSWTTGLGERYELLRRLHHDLDSDVYRGRDLLLDRLVTVVVHRGDAAHDADPLAHDTAWARQTRALRRLDHHHVAELHDGGVAGDDAFTVLRASGARTLDAELTRRRPSAAEAAGWCHDLARALAHVHGRVLVHGDPGPESVLVDDDGTVRWFRFTTATAVDPGEGDRAREADVARFLELAVALVGGRPGDALRQEVSTDLRTLIGQGDREDDRGTGEGSVDALAAIVRRARRRWRPLGLARRARGAERGPTPF